MDATTQERLEHLAEVIGWITAKKEMECKKDGYDYWTPSTWDNHFDRLAKLVVHEGQRFRLKPAKTRRPFTEQEARRLLGCVFVSPDGHPAVFNSGGTKEEYDVYAKKGWHYHLPGDPDNLKPCWVEE